ncbi:helix-turn-helix domain-containing protein [Glutamicibacter sp.]|uniref:IclR family transcriptional regulator n=1 Tax=Glutamicibacter sp. TaxID=1931995 RepID=UPI0028BE5596|nr:helix-turn-helix domain-containing protein [Glutamicibacter sp.]
MPTSQTLSRGIQVLEIVAAAPSALSIADVAAKLEVHRSIAYRIIRTLEQHRLLSRDEAGHIRPASGLTVLARSVQRDLQNAAAPELASLANHLSMTVFLAVWEHDVCTTLQSAQPRQAENVMEHRAGSVHSMALGADSIAIQSLFTKEQWRAQETNIEYRPQAREARIDGFASTQNEVRPGASCLAVPIFSQHSAPATLAALYPSALVPDRDGIVRALKEAALNITEALEELS